jgi:hypothetical protein
MKKFITSRSHACHWTIYCGVYKLMEEEQKIHIAVVIAAQKVRI